MRKHVVFLLLFWMGWVQLSVASASVVVTLTTDEEVAAPPAIQKAAQNLGIVLTEINRAQARKDLLVTKHLPMDQFSLRSMLRIWAVTPFYCDDAEIVERCWVFKDGSMMVSHIPLIITPKDESFGMGTYQEAVVEFDRDGTITDFRLALSAQMTESLERCGSVADKETQLIILQYIERFRTAYNQKDIETISRMFSDDALIITGKVVYPRKLEMQAAGPKVEYNRLNKEQYIRRLRLAFARNQWIDVKFSQIGDNGERGGCNGITRSEVDPTKYGVRLRQEWKSSTYSDEGYLFLLWDFPKGGGDPIIHVRTWQPQWVGGQQVDPDDDISTLGGFDL